MSRPFALVITMLLLLAASALAIPEDPANEPPGRTTHPTTQPTTQPATEPATESTTESTTDGAVFTPRYTTEEQTLLSIQEEGRTRVAEIAARMKAETDPVRRAELQAEGIAIKKQTRLRFLETLADFARARGDELTEQQARQQIDNLKNPRRAAGTPIRQAPTKAELRKEATR